MEFADEDLPTAFDARTCVHKGLCPVTKLRGQEDTTATSILESHSLYFEQHGKGTEYKIVFIIGLISSSFSWWLQVEHFGGGKAFLRDGEEGGEEKSSVLVFDNRGIGNSGYPRGPYSTSGMAEDLVCLLDYVKWKGERDVYVVRISLSGLITRGANHVGLLYPQVWLGEPDEGDPGKTNLQVQTEDFLRRVAITKPQELMGHVSQMVAGLTHSVSREKLRKISGSIPKVTIVTGDEDHLVRPSMSRVLKESMAEAELVEWDGTGHGVHAQRRRWFNELGERTAREGQVHLR